MPYVHFNIICTSIYCTKEKTNIAGGGEAVLSMQKRFYFCSEFYCGWAEASTGDLFLYSWPVHSRFATGISTE
jgi:hypothetical protein